MNNLENLLKQREELLRKYPHLKELQKQYNKSIDKIENSEYTKLMLSIKFLIDKNKELIEELGKLNDLLSTNN